MSAHHDQLSQTWEAYVEHVNGMPDDGNDCYFLEEPDSARWIFMDRSTGECKVIDQTADDVAYARKLVNNPAELSQRGTVLMKAAIRDGSSRREFSRISPKYANAIHDLLVRRGYPTSPVPERLGKSYKLA